MEKTAHITLDGLAAMVQQGFSEVGDRFDRVEREITQFRLSTDQRLERIEHRLPEFAYKFEVVDLEHRVARLEAKNR